LIAGEFGRWRRRGMVRAVVTVHLWLPEIERVVR
jgi:hypothetical protein